MCGRVNVTDHPAIQALMEEIGFPLYPKSEFYMSADIPPYDKPLITGFINEHGALDTAKMNWGWKRDWSKRLFNARRVSEKKRWIWESTLWREAIRKQRCLVPVNAFYEWDENQPGGKRDKYRIEYEEPAMALGGIYETRKDGKKFMAIITTDPNEKLAKIHHRMPVIIDKSDAKEWLLSDNRDAIDNLMQCVPDNKVKVTKEVR